MEVLKNDLRTIQGGIKELLGVSGSALSVPSWKFPSKQAAEVDTEEVLKSYAGAGAGEGKEDRQKQQFYLLELVVDRLLFLLQCCIHVSLSDGSLGQRSTNLPLTLGSTVKKFSKRMLQTTNAVKNLQKQISSKDAMISSLQVTASKLQEDYVQLQRSHAESGSDRELNNDDLSLVRPWTGASNCVPYEAMGTLKMSSLTVIPTEAQASQREVSTSVSSIPSANNPHSASQLQISSLLPQSQPEKELATVSTQTTDTAFALCARCSQTQETLISVANSVSVLCHEEGLTSSLAQVDWEALAKVGGMELGKWNGNLKIDLCSIGEHCCRLKETITELELERDSHKKMVGQLETEIQQLSQQMDTLQESVEDIQKRSEMSLLQSEESFSSQLKLLEQARDKLEARSSRMKEELNSTRRQEAHLRALVAELEHRRGQLQMEVETLQGREMQLSIVKKGLEEELKCSKSELEAYRDQLEESKVELSKTKVYSHTLDKRNKTLQGKQASLLCHLDELDQECAGLREELEQVESSHQKLQEEVKEMQSHCDELKEQLCAEQERLANSHQEQESLIQVVSELEDQLGEVRGQLDQEKHNCRLLMDYPFIKQVSGDYRAHISSLTNRDSEKQISANTVRILLLEEQNTELREKATIVPHAQASEGWPYQMRQATPLWRKSFLSQLQEEQAIAQQSSGHEMFHQPHPHTTSVQSTGEHVHTQSNNEYQQKVQSATKANRLKVNSSDQWVRNGHDKSLKTWADSGAPSADSCIEQSRASSAKLKGRLGHLVAAIAEAHSSTSSTNMDRHSNGAHSSKSGQPSHHVHSNAWMPADSSLDCIEVHTCSRCDKMYSDREALEHHQSICTI